MWRQQKKRNIQLKSNDFCGWLKAVITLMVVMGLTWIIGLAVVEIKELLPLAYIFTIVAAFQGVFIFLVLVIFTKGVRDEIINGITTIFDKKYRSNSSKVGTKKNNFLSLIVIFKCIQAVTTVIANPMSSNVGKSAIEMCDITKSSE